MRSGRWLGVHGSVRRKRLQTRGASSVEGINNKLRIIARRAYGFRSHGALISMPVPVAAEASNWRRLYPLLFEETPFW